MAETQFQYITLDTTREHPVVTITQPGLNGERFVRVLQPELLAAANLIEPSHLVLDLREVKMLQTLALQALLSLQRKLAEQSGRIVLCGLSPIVVQILEITALVASPARLSNTLFDVEPDVSAAIAHLNRLPPPHVMD